MNNDLPLRFDPVLFAKQGRNVSGNIELSQLPRLAASSKQNIGSVSVTLLFSMSSMQFPMVNGTIHGSIMQSCQRCLNDTEVPIEAEFILVMANPQALALASKEGHEIFEYTGQFVETITLIEDEIILGLPIVIKHEQISDCDPVAQKWMQKEPNEFVEEKDNPFASLKDLKI